MFVWLIQTYWHTRLKPLNLWCLPLLSFEIPQQPQNRNFRDSWLCNCSVTVPIFPSGTQTVGHSAKDYYYEVTACGNAILPNNKHLVLQQPIRSPRKASWEPLSEGWIQNISEKKFWEVKLFCQKASWALHGSIWFGAIISVLGWKYTFYHTRMLITLLSISQ